MLGLRTRKIEKRQNLVDTREAFNLWDILRSKYYILEGFEMNEKFVHDPDLKILIRVYIKHLQENKTILEDLMRKYAIMGPDQYRHASEWVGNSEATRDEWAAQMAMLYIQEHIENMLRASRTSVTNDEIRRVITTMLKQTIKISGDLYKYLKMKGWISTPPLYPNTPSENNERICCATASHLWDHLTLRYDNIRETKMYSAFANDGDFKILMEQGIATLVEQIAILERECKKFGITLPKKPAEVIIAPPNTEVVRDDQIYRTILTGFQGAGIMHAEALKQCTYNDRVRKIFEKMLFDEIDFYEFFLKYGKAKNWLHPVPSYKV